jgi:hypothetical protein
MSVMDTINLNFDVLVPITFLVLAFLAFRAWLSHRDHRRSALLQTLRAALDAGAEMPNEVWARLVRAADPKRMDLQRAIVFGVLAAVTAALGWLLPLQHEDGPQAFLAIAVIPGALAMMHLGFWRFWHGD